MKRRSDLLTIRQFRKQNLPLYFSANGSVDFTANAPSPRVPPDYILLSIAKFLFVD